MPGTERKLAAILGAARRRDNRGLTHCSCSRRSFVQFGIAGLAMTGLTAFGGRAAATPVQAGYVQFRAAPREVMEQIGPYRAYFARPDSAGATPAVMVLHDKFGLNAHYEDITRRVAREGFYAFAPDMFSPVGGSPDHWSKARTLFKKLIVSDLERDLVATVGHLNNHPDVDGPIACMGFGWGGTMAASLAVHEQNLAAAVIVDGVARTKSDVGKIRARIQLHYAGQDARLTVAVRSYSKALAAADIDHVVHVYDGVDAGFFDETDDANFNAEAAAIAWTRTISLLRQTLNV